MACFLFSSKSGARVFRLNRIPRNGGYPSKFAQTKDERDDGADGDEDREHGGSVVVLVRVLGFRTARVSNFFGFPLRVVLGGRRVAQILFFVFRLDGQRRQLGPVWKRRQTLRLLAAKDF